MDIGLIAQLVEHYIRIVEVVGSNPTKSTSIKLSGILPTNSATAEFRIRFAKYAAGTLLFLVFGVVLK